MAFTLSSSAFSAASPIPARFTCDGSDASPPLAWTDVPGETKAFALVCDDPDAPVGTWVHWVLYDLPAATRDLPTGVPAQEQLTDGSRQGLNDFGRVGYGGPCPPRGPAHRYFFKLYALDALTGLSPRATKADLLKAIQGHTVGTAELVGTYKR
jgi:Raf kinase inhibitor-like YbhB/YbcL family protein